MSKHKLKVFEWIHGQLKHKQFEFKSLEEAKHHSKKHKGHKKIYDESGSIVHTEDDDNHTWGTYA